MPRGNENDREEPFLVRTTPRRDDAAGTHNELRSHGRCRCLVVRQAPMARLLMDTYRSELKSVRNRGGRVQNSS